MAECFSCSPREELTIPENDLQKSLVGGQAVLGGLGEHEQRFRKSTERMHVPDWYRDYGQVGPAPAGGPLSATTSGVSAP